MGQLERGEVGDRSRPLPAGAAAICDLGFMAAYGPGLTGRLIDDGQVDGVGYSHTERIIDHGNVLRPGTSDSAAVRMRRPESKP
jgi:hypothetical protein